MPREPLEAAAGRLDHIRPGRVPDVRRRRSQGGYGDVLFRLAGIARSVLELPRVPDLLRVRGRAFMDKSGHRRLKKGAFRRRSFETEARNRRLKKQAFKQFLKFLLKKTRTEVSVKDAVFHRSYAKFRHQPFPHDKSRTWLSVLLREGMTDYIRRQLYPGRFDLGNIRPNHSQSGTVKDMLAEINEENGPQEDGSIVAVRDLKTVLNGIRTITGRKIGSGVKDVPLIDLKTLKRLYRIDKECGMHMFGLIEPPDQSNKPTLDFEDRLPDARNEARTALVSDLLSQLSVEIDDERLARINRTLHSLSETLLVIEEQNSAISRTLGARFPNDLRAKASAFRGLAESINDYVPYRMESTNALDDAVYTYLRTLRFVHYAGGYEEAIKKSTITKGIVPVEIELTLLCRRISEDKGYQVHSNTLVTSVNEFQKFVKSWASPFIALIEKATGLPVERRHLQKIAERGRRILFTYYRHNVGEKDNDVPWLSVLDCAAALCTVHQEAFIKTEHRQYSHGQVTPAHNVLLQLKVDRPIEKLDAEDYVPHSISQILYNRWCEMHVALTEDADYREYADALMCFQVARNKKYAKCLRSNDVDVISQSVVRFGLDCLGMAANCNVHTASVTPTFFDKMNRWLSPSDK